MQKQRAARANIMMGSVGRPRRKRKREREKTPHKSRPQSTEPTLVANPE